jgi:ubiquinone/menaquinone biosynthesis C-methylase UbiE
MILPGRRAVVQGMFHLLYTRFAWTYDRVSRIVSLGHWQSWGQTSLPFVAGPRVLELGHGPGHLLATMVNRDWQPVGIDVSPQMGRLAWNKLEKLGHTARLVRGQGQSLPFGTGTFDTVVAVFPAPYIIEPETIEAIRRVLRPGGRLVVVPEAELTGSDPALRALEWLFTITGQRSKAGPYHSRNDNFWPEVLSHHGFSVTVHDVSLPDSCVVVVVAERH